MHSSNAIQVKNIARAQVGHLPRAVASKLAPLLDRRAVTVEGVINDGNRNVFLNHLAFLLSYSFTVVNSNGYTMSMYASLITI